jgi:hypothetical protein
MLKKKDIDEFIELCYKHTGVRLEPKEAEQQAEQLVKLVKVLIKECDDEKDQK